MSQPRPEATEPQARQAAGAQAAAARGSQREPHERASQRSRTVCLEGVPSPGSLEGRHPENHAPGPRALKPEGATWHPERQHETRAAPPKAGAARPPPVKRTEPVARKPP